MFPVDAAAIGLIVVLTIGLIGKIVIDYRKEKEERK